MKKYDAAAHRFYSSQNFNSLPLTSWDIYATFFQNICDGYSDIVQLTQLAKVNKWCYQDSFNEALLHKQHVIVVTDPELKIVHATKNIVAMNGYLPEEILGAKPNMFQGAETCRETTQMIKLAVQKKESFEANILNYRKDGSTYKCWIKGEPIFNTSGEVVNFIAYEKEVA